MKEKRLLICEYYISPKTKVRDEQYKFDWRFADEIMQAKQSNKPCMSSKTKSRTDLHHNQEPLMINVVTTRIPASSRTLNYIPIWKSYCITRLIYIYIE